MDTKLKAIIFDFDGVIHDTFDLAYSINQKVTSESHEPISKEEYKSFFEGNVLEKVYSTFDGQISVKFREHESIAFDTLKMDDDIKKELQKLKEKYELYIISSNTEKNLLKYFQNNNFSNIFSDILAEETHKSKVEKFKILFKKYDLNPHNCIFITDTLGDIKEANQVNVRSIACTFGFHDEERLRKGNPYLVISKFREIIPSIESISLE